VSTQNDSHQYKTGTVKEYIHALRSSERFGPQVVYQKEIPARQQEYGQLDKEWPLILSTAIQTTGIHSYYTHQAEAINLIRKNKNVIVATPTASGKSLIYNLPVIEKIITSPGSKALYLFPLKALAQDQLRAFNEITDHLPEANRPSAALYDGDTTPYLRKKLRQNTPDILISNPDMLHLSMLAYHESWPDLFARLTHVVLDEVHTYRGTFGTHMSWVLRRLLRLCHYYGSKPVFILSSATIGNPEELAEKLLGFPVEVVSSSGAPQAARNFIFFNPFESPSHAACQMLEAAVKRELRTIVYTQSRKMTELISIWTSNRLSKLADKICSYRAGYLPEERRVIEGKLSSGELLGVISTSALELGIDIGTLDICVLVGYPGTIMTTWQRSGRVGRQQRDSLVILIAQEDALDQYFMRNPEDFFQRGVEDAVLNPDNRTLMAKHLVCAAAEIPLHRDDPLMKRREVIDMVNRLTDRAKLLQNTEGDRWFSSRRYPQRKVDLRGSGSTYMIYQSGSRNILGEIDGFRCQHDCHPGAVYLHQGKSWLVETLDLDNHEVLVSDKRVPYFTRPLTEKHTEILQTLRSTTFGTVQVHMGTLKVTEKVTGFQKKLLRGHRLIETIKLDLPPHVFETEGLWIEIPTWLQNNIEQQMLHFMGGIHALEHAAIGIFPLLVLCDRNDIGGIAHQYHEQVGSSAVFIYDGYPGGVGLCRNAFENITKLLLLSYNSIKTCSCEIGCPSCIHSPKCGSGNRPMDKHAARLILESLLQQIGRPAQNTVSTIVRQPDRKETDKKNITKVKRFGVFDLETKRSAAEVGGWHNASRMGISVAVLYDSLSGSFHTYWEKDIPRMVEHLRELDLVVGFNNKRFDNKVLSAYTMFNLHSLPTLDILDVIHQRLGYRLSLDRLAEHTLGVKKSADGLLALQWFKEGRLEEIREYCRDDVRITRDLFLFGLQNQHLLFQNKTGNVVRLPIDFSIELAT
jgi:DEAD/DEAH box helicase domain-containing protein